MRLFHFSRVAVLALVAGLVCAAGAYAAVIGLPPDGSQVNNDPANGIDPQQDAGVSDVVGGSLVPGGPRVPWGTFEQKSASSQQIFVRAFLQLHRRSVHQRRHGVPGGGGQLAV